MFMNEIYWQSYEVTAILPVIKNTVKGDIKN